MIEKLNLFIDIYDEPLHVSIKDGVIWVIHGKRNGGKRVAIDERMINNSKALRIDFGPDGELRLK